MSSEDQSYLLRFDLFELDLRTRELRQQGRLIKLQDLPVRLLIFLATRQGDLVTREEIEKELWGDDHFVDFDHGINTAMKKIREALGENSESPRFIETLPRKGYRFIALVTQGNSQRSEATPAAVSDSAVLRSTTLTPLAAMKINPPSACEADPVRETLSQDRSVSKPVTAENVVQATPPAQAEAEFRLPYAHARGLFLLVQVGYLAMYFAALYKLDSAVQVLSRFLNIPAGVGLPVIVVAAACGVAIRLYLLTSVGLKHPDAGSKYHQIFPLLFLLDVFWSASPLLLVEKIGLGLAPACVAALAYLPFSQRILMRSIYSQRPIRQG